MKLITTNANQAIQHFELNGIQFSVIVYPTRKVKIKIKSSSNFYTKIEDGEFHSVETNAGVSYGYEVAFHESEGNISVEYK